MRRDAQAGVLWWSCQSPASHSCGLLNHLNSFCRGMFKFNAKFDADSLLYLFSHFECDGHTVHMLTQWHLPSPLTSAVKWSWFMHAHSSPLSLAARLHQCHANCSHYINNSQTFFQTDLRGLTVGCWGPLTKELVKTLWEIYSNNKLTSVQRRLFSFAVYSPGSVIPSLLGHPTYSQECDFPTPLPSLWVAVSAGSGVLLMGLSSRLISSLTTVWG